MAVRSILRSLEHRNFRLFFIGQLLSLVGTWMQLTALPWYVLEITGRPTLLGIVDFAGKFPALLFTPLAGVVSDRVNRHRLLLFTQFASMLQAFALAALVLAGPSVPDTAPAITAPLAKNVLVVFYLIVFFSVGLSVINAFDLTGRQSFLHEMLDRKEDLGNAIALNSSTFNAARLIGPSLAGVLMTALSAGECFLVNGLSFVAVLVALCVMRVQPREIPHSGGRWWRGLGEGVSYAFRSRPIRAILVLVAITSVLGVPYVVLIPVYVKEVLHGGATLNGLMVSAPGLGALTAALFVAARRHVLGLIRGIILGPAFIGLGMLAMSSIPGPEPNASKIGPATFTGLMLFGIGFVVVTLLTSCNAILQTIVVEDKRGRVVSLYAMAFGISPIGSLAAGALAEQVGVQSTLRLGGLACIVAAALFLFTLGRSLREDVWAWIKVSDLAAPSEGV
jgi:MFS family permease